MSLLTKSDIDLGKAHLWVSRLADEEIDHLRALAAEYGPALRHAVRAVQITRNAPDAIGTTE